MVPLVVLEEGSYEKDVLMYVNLGVPQMVGGKSVVQISRRTYAFRYLWLCVCKRAIALEFIVLGRTHGSCGLGARRTEKERGQRGAITSGAQ